MQVGVTGVAKVNCEAVLLGKLPVRRAVNAVMNFQIPVRSTDITAKVFTYD